MDRICSSVLLSAAKEAFSGVDCSISLTNYLCRVDNERRSTQVWCTLGVLFLSCVLSAKHCPPLCMLVPSWRVFFFSGGISLDKYPFPTFAPLFCPVYEVAVWPVHIRRELLQDRWILQSLALYSSLLHETAFLSLGGYIYSEISPTQNSPATEEETKHKLPRVDTQRITFHTPDPIILTKTINRHVQTGAIHSPTELNLRYRIHRYRGGWWNKGSW